ncbi:MAG: hypothetical protein ACWA5K_05465 [bacterium]
MSDNSLDDISPIEVPLTRPVTEAGGDGATYWYQKKSTVIALVICVIAALAVVLVLPLLVEPKPADSIPVEIVSGAAEKPLESPWEQAQLAEARRKAQDILSGLLAKQKFLESRNVNDWNRESYQQALALAEDGDTRYRQREFPQAISLYQQADLLLSELEQSIPDRLQDALDRGDAALAAGNGEEAASAFNLASSLDPANQSAKSGLERAGNIKTVMALMEEGDAAKRNGDLASALARYKEAASLDPAFVTAADRASETAAEISQQQFLQWMSEGYDALDRGDLSGARSAFEKAVAINPQDEAANSALDQAKNRIGSQWIAGRLREASSKQAAEDWQAAVDLYDSVIKRDASVIDARVGLIQSETRLALEKDILKILEDPARLSSSAVFTGAVATLRDARGIPNSGPRLQDQIQRLDAALAAASSPVTVHLQSDAKTRVTVFRVGELGTFNEKVLSLKPGRYVAVGSRKGYRDVRVEFEVVSGQQQHVEVVCRERV